MKHLWVHEEGCARLSDEWHRAMAKRLDVVGPSLSIEIQAYRKHTSRKSDQYQYQYQ